MLRPRIPDDAAREKKASEIAEKLLSKKLFPVHGQFIDGSTARDQLELDVDVLEKHDELWELIWQYYVRCEIQMNMPLPQMPTMVKTKLFESQGVSLVIPDAPA